MIIINATVYLQFVRGKNLDKDGLGLLQYFLACRHLPSTRTLCLAFASLDLAIAFDKHLTESEEDGIKFKGVLTRFWPV